MSRKGRSPARREPPSSRAAREPIEPIFRRLPSGPHSLAPREIAVHQRARIHGAMVEAVARGGYDGVTVRRLIGLAGVSRRTFYDHFANRHDCFLQTAGTIAERELGSVRKACMAHGGPSPRSSLAAGLGAIASGVGSRPDAFRLLIVDSLAAGDTGAALLGETLASCQRMLAVALVREPGTALPGPVLRALTGALHGMLVAELRNEPVRAPEVLAAEMTGFAMALSIPGRDGAAEELAARLRDRARRAAAAASRRRPEPPRASDPRERMLLGAMRLAARQPVARLSLPEIADEADVAIDALMEAFPASEDCLGEALAGAGERLLRIALRAQQQAPDWPQATRLALAGMLGHLAAHPTQARALALVSQRAGAAARRQADALDRALGTVLTEGAPAGGLPAPAAAGAFWHTVRQALIEGRGDLLTAFSDHLGYALLAPAIGAEAAIEKLRRSC